MGNGASAVASFEEAVRLASRSTTTLGFLGHAYAVSGNRSKAEQLLAELVALRSKRYVSGYDIGLIHLGLGDQEEAAGWLERAESERAHHMAFVRVDPRLDPLRGSQRFERLLARMKLD